MTYQPFPSPFLISGTFAEGAAVTAADPGVVILGVDQTPGAPGTYEPMNLTVNSGLQQSGDRGPIVFGLTIGDLDYHPIPLRLYNAHAIPNYRYAVNIGPLMATDISNDHQVNVYTSNDALMVTAALNNHSASFDDTGPTTFSIGDTDQGIVTVVFGPADYTATVVFEANNGAGDDEWVPVYGYPPIGPPTTTVTVDGNTSPIGTWTIPVAGYSQLRLRATAWAGADAISVFMYAGSSAGPVTQRVMLSNGTVFADVLDLTNNNPLAVALVDTAGTQISTLPVSLASVPSHAVTNAGTFAVQATLAAETTKVIGTVNQGTSPWVISGAVTTSGTVTATLAAETTKVIGTVNQGTSPWVVSGAVTLTSTTITGTVAATQSGTWNVGTVTPGSAAANLGKIQGAGYVAGDTGVMGLAVRRDAGTAVSGTGNLQYGPLLMDVLNHLWIAGSHVDGGTYSTAGVLATTVSSLIIGAVYDDTPLSSVATGKSGGLRMSANRNLYGTIRDAAGNERGANVDASNRLTVLATQTGTWTVQPGNTPNTTAWLTDFPAPSNVTSTAYEASHLIKASAGTLYSLTGYNSKTSAQFIQVHNATAVPADTAVPVVIFSVPASSNFAFELQRGRVMSTGIAVCNSSTGPTKTVGAGDVWFDCQYL